MRFVFFTGFLLTAVLSNGQPLRSEKSAFVTIEILKTEAQAEMDSVEHATEFLAAQLTLEAEDTLNKLSAKYEAEFFALDAEAQKEVNRYMHKNERNLFNRLVMSNHYQKKYHALEDEYALRGAALDQKYEAEAQRLESEYSQKIEKVVTDGQLKMEEIESRYEKEMALLEIEING